MKRLVFKRSVTELSGEELARTLNYIASAVGRGPVGDTREARSEIAAVLHEAGKRLKRAHPAAGEKQ